MKKSEHKVSLAIESTAADVWEVIGAVSGVEQWLAPITACRFEGNKRYCTTESGSFEEDILKIDHENRVLKYAIPSQQMIPVENIVGTMSVREGDGGGAVVDWHWIYDVAEDNEAEAKAILAQVGEAGIYGIDALIKSRQPLSV